MAKRSIVKSYEYWANTLAPLRRLLFPIYYIGLTLDLIARVYWLLRNEYRKLHLGCCGDNVHIQGRFQITSPGKCQIGNNVHINKNAFLRAEGGLEIGDNTHIAQNFVVYTMNHNYAGECLPYDETIVAKPVVIGRNVWVGINVTICPGVSIGEGAIIGMGSVISRDVPARAIVASSELKILKYRDAEHYDALEQAQKYGGMAGVPRQ